MDRSTPRMPSPWWVLVPGVLLVLVGVRAVTAEVNRARESARERARGAATQVARAFETLVEEYVAPLPATGATIDVEAADEATRHLYPTWIAAIDGRRILSGRLREAHPLRPVSAAVERRDVALAEELLYQVEAAEGAEDVNAASLLAGAAAAVETQWVEGVLRVAAIRAEVRQGEPATAAAQLEKLLALPPEIAVPEGSPLRPARPWLAACELALLHPELRYADVISVPVGPDDGAGSAFPHWWTDAAEVISADPWGLAYGRRGSLLARLHEPMVGSFDGAQFDEMVATDNAVREASSTPVDRDREVFWRPTKRGMLALQRRLVIDVKGVAVEALVGGAIPVATIQTRVADAALADPGANVILRAPDGSVAFGARTVMESGLVEDVTLGGLATGWRVEARVAVPTGMPRNAWLLGGALALSTLMLGLGAMAMTRAASHHARLAEERRTFLDHVAHEVRTPASAMLALSEELERGHVDPERHATYHEHLLREARRLADLVEETLDLARLEGGRLVAKREAADLRDVVRDAFEAARIDTDRMTVTMPGDSVPVSIDHSAVRRAVRNLVDNALKHGAADEPIDVRLTTREGRATLTVRDHGKGIPGEHLERIFERFHRVPSTTHEVKGVGLGLALVREVAEAHGGSVTAESPTDGGARFTFILPTEGSS